MAAHVARRKEGLEVNMLVRDSFVCQSINENHHNWYFIAFDFYPNTIHNS